MNDDDLYKDLTAAIVEGARDGALQVVAMALIGAAVYCLPAKRNPAAAPAAPPLRKGKRR